MFASNDGHKMASGSNSELREATGEASDITN